MNPKEKVKIRQTGYTGLIKSVEHVILKQNAVQRHRTPKYEICVYFEKWFVIFFSLLFQFFILLYSNEIMKIDYFVDFQFFLSIVSFSRPKSLYLALGIAFCLLPNLCSFLLLFVCIHDGQSVGPNELCFVNRK